MRFTKLLVVHAVLCLLFAAPVPAQELHQEGAPAPTAPADFAGSWGGSIMVSGTPIGILLKLTQEEGGWKGTLDIPSQGVVGLELSDIRIEGDSIQMSIPAPTLPTFTGKVTGDYMSGTFTQHGETHGWKADRGAPPGPNRPQTPSPPFPYISQAITFSSGDIHLSGTLTLPRGDGPFPVVLFVSGSGPQDRNLEIFGHKPFLLLADQLTRGGMATLRWDDRGVGGSSGVLEKATTEDLAGDILAGIEFLKHGDQRNKIDTGRVGILGYSEGSTVAAVAATRSDDVRAVVLLAPMGIPGREVLMEQAAIVSRSANVPQDFIDLQRERQTRLFDAVIAGAPEDTLRARTVALMKARLPTPKDEEIRAKLGEEMARLESPWFRHFLEYDPRDALTRLHVPVLALTGEKDVQVSPGANLPRIQRALEEAGNPDATVEAVPNLNHLFQECLTGKFEEYAGINQTMAPSILDRIRTWLSQRLAAS